MIPLPLPYVLLALLLSNLVAGSLGYWKGGVHKENELAAQDARDAKVLAVAQSAVAQEIAKMKVVNQTVRAKTEVITREVPVYRDCLHDDRTLGLLNDALTPPERRPVEGQLP